MPDFLAWTDDVTPDPEVQGGKGAGLFRMTAMGVPVPEFVVIPASLCVEYMEKPAETKMKIKGMVPQIIEIFETAFGQLPLFSVRSGARVSMPGMMDTILNVGVNTIACKAYTTNMTDRQVNDCLRRFLHMFGSTVHGIDDQKFENEMHKARTKASVETDSGLTAQQLYDVADRFYEIFSDAGHECPNTLADQLFDCIIAVMESWNSPRAKEYRKHNAIPDDWGTAVVIQRMVFGNMNEQSGSGVLFTRNPDTGANAIHAEYLANAQGEDVVAGIRTPEKLAVTPNEGGWVSGLFDLCLQLEDELKDMLDIEFTVEDDKLYLLQVRTAKRSARAWVRSSFDLLKDGVIDDEMLRQRIKRQHIKTLSQPVIDPSFTTEADFTGLPACAGVVTGRAVFTAKQAVASSEPCILIRHETSPDDIAGMFAAVGIVTATGGSTSHAAVVARGMDKVCVTGCKDLKVGDGAAMVDDVEIAQGDKVTVDGTTGRIWVGCDVPVSDPSNDPEMARLMEYVMAANPGSLGVALPGSPGSVYSLAQFITDVPAPTTGATVYVIDDGALDDPLLTCTGPMVPAGLFGEVVKWAEANGLAVQLVTPSEVAGVSGDGWSVKVLATATGLDALLARPVTHGEIERFFSGSLEAVKQLLAPAKLEDKFMLTRCYRYDLMATFG